MSLNDRMFRLTLWQQQVKRELQVSRRKPQDALRILRLVRLNALLYRRLSDLLSQKLAAVRA